MGTVNQGGQRIGWKYSTPLQADYLNTFIAGVTSPGLVTRQSYQPQSSGGQSAMVIIPPLSLYVVPTDKLIVDEQTGEKKWFNLVKVTTTTSVTIDVKLGDCAIGFEFSFADKGIPQSQWYGSFESLTPERVKDYKGIIVATIIAYEHDGQVNFSITDSGADISDCLLLQEGWDPCCWLSVISPRRMAGDKINKFEVRRHNDAYTGYMNGLMGCVYIDKPTYSVPTDPFVDPDGTRGTELPNIINLFNLTTEGFSLCDSGSEFPIPHTKRGVFAYVDATNSKTGSSGPSADTAYINKLPIKPVSKEDINMWFEDESGTLYIQ